MNTWRFWHAISQKLKYLVDRQKVNEIYPKTHRRECASVTLQNTKWYPRYHCCCSMMTYMEDLAHGQFRKWIFMRKHSVPDEMMKACLCVCMRETDQPTIFLLFSLHRLRPDWSGPEDGGLGGWSSEMPGWLRPCWVSLLQATHTDTHAEFLHSIPNNTEEIINWQCSYKIN